MAEVACSGCGKAFDESFLSTKVLTVESCPTCGEVIRKSEGFSYTDAKAIQIEDVAAIDTWLDTIDAEKERQTIDKRTVWTIKANRPYRCEASYDPKSLNFAKLRMSSTEDGERVTADKNKLQMIFGRHGVQPHGKRESKWNIESGESFEITWGAMQFVSTNSLCPELFWAVVDRLQTAMDDARNA